MRGIFLARKKLKCASKFSGILRATTLKCAQDEGKMRVKTLKCGHGMGEMRVSKLLCARSERKYMRATSSRQQIFLLGIVNCLLLNMILLKDSFRYFNVRENHNYNLINQMLQIV
jgi:hypothetical protein